MTQCEKTLQSVLRGTSDANIDFQELHALLNALGFKERIRGDHHIYSRENLAEIINIQPKGAMAKAYQVKQIRNLIVKYRLGEDLK
jgi:predicted RNA binding protein YcfA (HicA-like mRNA interferase family)